MSKYKPFLFFLLVVGFFIVFYKISHSPENDADKYYRQYLGKITTVKLLPLKIVDPDYAIDFTHYNTGFTLIGYKALSGSIYVFNFQDSASNKYFSLRLFDKNFQITYSLDQELVNKEILAYADKYCLDNPDFGTKKNPIPIFNFKGIKEPIRIESNNPGSVNGYKTLEPTQAEYEHNVLTYLRYVMPQKEFNARFKSN